MKRFNQPFASNPFRVRIPGLGATPGAELSNSGRPALGFGRGAILRLLFVALLSSLLALFAPQTPVAKAEVIFGSPTVSLDSTDHKDVWDYALGGNSIFWRTATECPKISTNPGVPGEIPVGDKPEVITQSTLPKGAKIEEPWLERKAPDPAACNPYQIRSNIVADGNFVYFVDNEGLKRLAKGQVLDQYIASGTVATSIAKLTQLTQDSEAIYGVERLANGNSGVWRIAKNPLSPADVSFLGSDTGEIFNLATDGTYVYWRNNQAVLKRLTISAFTIIPLATSVSSFYPEIPHGSCPGGDCPPNSYVWIAQGHQLRRYDNNTETLGGLVYLADLPSTGITNITSNANKVFWTEVERVDTDEFLVPFYVTLFSMDRTGIQPEMWYSSLTYPTAPTGHINHLTATDKYVLWQDGVKVWYLDLEKQQPIPQTNMQETGMEVTQGIQDLKNSVLLVQGRRTFVRVYAKTQDPKAKPVPQVTASLYATWNGVKHGPLWPQLKLIDVKPKPQRHVLDDSFLFELPWEWTR